MRARVRVYTTRICPYCVRAKMLLKAKGVHYEEIDVSGDYEKRAWLVEATGQRTVPQIFNDESVGGFDELRALIARASSTRSSRRRRRPSSARVLPARSRRCCFCWMAPGGRPGALRRAGPHLRGRAMPPVRIGLEGRMMMS